MPDQAKNDVLPLLHDQRRSDGDDDTTDLLGSLDSLTQVFLDLKDVQRFLQVDELGVNGAWDCMIHHFAKQRLFESLRRKKREPEKDSGPNGVEELHRIGIDGKDVGEIGVTSVVKTDELGKAHSFFGGERMHDSSFFLDFFTSALDKNRNGRRKKNDYSCFRPSIEWICFFACFDFIYEINFILKYLKGEY